MQAIWNGTVIAESDATIVVEGTHYFPAESIHKAFYRPSDYSTKCHWKGTASYYSLEVNGETNENAAWYYPSPMEQAKNIRGYVAFWRGVEVIGTTDQPDLTAGMNPEDLVC